MPEITIYFSPTEAIAYDVTVCYPDETGSAEIGGISAAKAAHDKHRKHSGAVSAEGHKFVALCFETFGHMDQAVDRFVADVTARFPEWDRKNARTAMLIALSSAVAKGAARMVRCRVEQLRRSELYAAVSP